MNKINFSNILSILNKYNIPGGRYTYFPFHAKWNNQIDNTNWPKILLNDYNGPVDVYIHIPFCHSLCTFCGCNIKIVKNNFDNQSYVEKVHQEWAQFNNKFSVSHLYLGGGTPNFLTPTEIKKLLDPFVFTKDKKITIELDPRTLTIDDLVAYKEIGINRLSFGIQDFNEDVLRNVNRIQSFNHIEELIKKANQLEFEFINLDFIYGLTYQTNESLKETFQLLEKFNVTSISLYPFAKAPWLNNTQKAFGDFKEFTLFEMNELFVTISSILYELNFEYIGMGFFSKEKINYHRNIMGFTPQKEDYLIGLGVSAISSTPQGHIQNDKIYDRYMQGSEFSFFKTHLKTPIENQQEHFFEKLICRNEITKDDFQTFKLNNTEIFFNTFVELNLIKKVQDGYIITPEGRFFHKTILQHFDPNFSI